MAMAEIEVIGGGIFGLSVAYACLMRGARVRLIERADIGAGASGGVVGAMAPHTPDNWNDKKQFQFESLIASAEYWRGVDELSGMCSGYVSAGRIVPVMAEKDLPLAMARVQSAKGFWRGHAQWNVIPSGQFPGWEPASPTGYLIHDTLTAHIDPAAACQSLAKAVTVLGGQIVLGQFRGKGADATVICTGYQGILDLSAELGQSVGIGVKGQGLVLDHEARGLPQIFADALHIIPHANGTVAVGSTSERAFSDGNTTDGQLDDILVQARQLCPVLTGAAVLQRWAGVRPRARKRTPILGRHPLRKNTFIANGAFKIGFGVSVKVGEVMADLVLNGAADIPQKFTVEGNLA